jgi:competence protein ComEC
MAPNRKRLTWIPAARPRSVSPVRIFPYLIAGLLFAAEGGAQRPDSSVVVRVLDVGQGDAILIENGGSRVLIDGGPNQRALGRYLDRYGINGDTIDAVILTHAHGDHYLGLRELFVKRRRITVRYLWENQDPSPNVTLRQLRQQISARVRDGSLTYRDTDDPCATGEPQCVIFLRGGATLHILRPDPAGEGANNRSVAVKLVAADSQFAMWFAGDAEHQEIDWFGQAAGYAQNPGMRSDVLKLDHHGSCDGITSRYLDLVRPSLAIASLDAVNDYGHMHAQAKELLLRRQVDWYRTDQNGTVTLRWPAVAGNGFSIEVERGGRNLNGPSDRRSRQAACRGM